MATYKLSNGNVIVAEQDFIDAHHPGAELLPEQSASIRTTILSKLEFMNRFTDLELAGIYTAAKSSVAVEIWLEKFKLASEINLDDPRTVAGIQALEDGGLLAAGRAAEILA